MIHRTRSLSFVVAAFLAGSVPAAHAADVTVQPAAGSGFVVKDAGGANERLRVQESGAVSLPSVVGAPTQAQGLCIGAAGQLGPCTGGGASLPSGTVNQTLRYGAGNALAANNLLQAFSDGGLLATGAFGTGAIPASGTGARMMWYPAKAAFRAGWVNTNAWDDANVGTYSVAIGENTQASGSRAVAMGGGATASGDYSLAAGLLTSAEGIYSMAMGNDSHATQRGAVALGEQVVADGRSSVALGSGAGSGGHKGSFLFHDYCPLFSGCAPYANTADNQFMVSASGGILLYTGSSSGVQLPPGSGSWASMSDRNAKTAIRTVDPREVLEKVAALPLNTWQYKSQEAKYRHMGPMAQDFHATFGLGETDRSIDVVDADGVALAAIQGLYAQVKDRDAEIAALRGELAAQKTRVAALESLAGDLAEVKAQLAALRKPAAAATSVALRQP